MSIVLALFTVRTILDRLPTHVRFVVIVTWWDQRTSRVAVFSLEKQYYVEFLEALYKATGQDWKDMDVGTDAEDVSLLLKERVRFGREQVPPGRYQVAFRALGFTAGTMYLEKRSALNGQRTVAQAAVELTRNRSADAQSKVVLDRTSIGLPMLCEIHTPLYVFRARVCGIPK